MHRSPDFPDTRHDTLHRTTPPGRSAILGRNMRLVHREHDWIRLGWPGHTSNVSANGETPTGDPRIRVVNNAHMTSPHPSGCLRNALCLTARSTRQRCGQVGMSTGCIDIPTPLRAHLDWNRGDGRRADRGPGCTRMTTALTWQTLKKRRPNTSRSARTDPDPRKSRPQKRLRAALRPLAKLGRERACHVVVSRLHRVQPRNMPTVGADNARK